MKGYHFPLNNIENEVVLKKTAHKICQSNFNIYLYYFYCFYFLYILIKMYHVPLSFLPSSIFSLKYPPSNSFYILTTTLKVRASSLLLDMRVHMYKNI